MSLEEDEESILLSQPAQLQCIEYCISTKLENAHQQQFIFHSLVAVPSSAIEKMLHLLNDLFDLRSVPPLYNFQIYGIQ